MYPQICLYPRLMSHGHAIDRVVYILDDTAREREGWLMCGWSHLGLPYPYMYVCVHANIKFIYTYTCVYICKVYTYVCIIYIYTYVCVYMKSTGIFNYKNLCICIGFTHILWTYKRFRHTHIKFVRGVSVAQLIRCFSWWNQLTWV